MNEQQAPVKYTPGPWTVEDPMEGELSIVQANKPSYEWRFIATVPDADLEDGFPQEVVEANARLIASAPELLEALKTLLPDGWDDGVMDHIPGVKLARLAIAKANGQKFLADGHDSAKVEG